MGWTRPGFHEGRYKLVNEPSASFLGCNFHAGLGGPASKGLVIRESVNIYAAAVVKRLLQREPSPGRSEVDHVVPVGDLHGPPHLLGNR